MQRFRELSLLAQAGLLVAIFVVVTALAAALGAHNLGTALGFGQIAFALALAATILRGP